MPTETQRDEKQNRLESNSTEEDPFVSITIAAKLIQYRTSQVTYGIHHYLPIMMPPIGQAAYEAGILPGQEFEFEVRIKKKQTSQP